MGTTATKRESLEIAHAHIGTTRYKATITSGGHTIISDEPETLGGGDTGMGPYNLLLASLGSCTTITLRMYIERKMWIVERIDVRLELFKTDKGTYIERQLSFKGELNAEQKNRLLQIANSCPIHKILTGSIEIGTVLVDDEQ